MNFLKRGYLAVVRRKSRSLILLLILVIMSTSILASLSIVNAAQKATILARESIGSHATLTFDYRQNIERSINSQNLSPNLNSVLAYEETALQVADHGNVVDYNFIINTYAMAENFTPVGSTSSENQGPYSLTSPEIIVIGVSNTELLNSLDGDSIRLVEGRHIDKNSENEAIIERNLADKNSISIGSTIELGQFNGEDVNGLTVVGIYENHETSILNFNNIGVYSPIIEPANRIYVSYEMGKKIRPDEITTTHGNLRLPSAGVDRVVYFIDEPHNVQMFLDETRALPLQWDELRLDANDRAYNIMVEPVNRVANFTRKIIYATAIIGAIIISLILMLWIKERNYETGVLLSIGEEKSKIIAQYVCEVLVIALVAFTISTAAGSMISQNAANRMMDRQLNHITEENGELTVRELVNQGISNSSRLRRIVGVSGNLGEPIETIDVRVSFAEVWKMMILAIVIIAFSVILPVINVMRFNPKTILTQVN